jgi:hypothetical protein
MGDVLIVDKSVERRGALKEAITAKGVACADAEDAFSAMNALGKGEYDSLIAHAGKRHLSLRGLLQLAKRKNPEVHLVVLADEEDEEAVRRAMGADVLVLLASLTPAEIAEQGVVQRPRPEPEPEPEPEPQPASPPAEAGDEAASEAEQFAGPPKQSPTDSVGFGKLPAKGSFDAGTGGTAPTTQETADSDISGEVDVRLGAESLMEAFARELTGAMRVGQGEETWTLFLYGGEPAWVRPPGGDRAVFEKLVAAKAVPADAQPEPVPDGELLAALIAEGALEEERAVAVMRDVVTECTLELAAAKDPPIETVERPDYLSSPPPFRLNPFGMLLEARRKGMTPDELLAEGHHLENATLSPRSALDRVAGKVAPFVRGADLPAVLGPRPTLDGFREAAGLDMLMGTLLAFSLVDAGLARIEPATNGDGAAAPVPLPQSDEPASADDAGGGMSAEEACAALEEAVLPNEILGVDIDADLIDIEAAYDRLVAALSLADDVEPGLRSRVEKARTRLDRAVQTMRATAI